MYNKTTFVNELGNKISLRVKNVKDIGFIKSGDPIEFGAVHLSMAGPTSESTWTITHREADELRKALNKFLAKK